MQGLRTGVLCLLMAAGLAAGLRPVITPGGEICNHSRNVPHVRPVNAHATSHR